MIIRPYIGKQYNVKSVDYLRGILHVYARLNEPQTNLVYDYDLLELGTGLDIQLLLKAQEDFKDETPILTAISTDAFIEELQSWLFKNGELTELNLTAQQQDQEVKFLYKALGEALTLKEVFKISELSGSYHFGVYYDYYVLETHGSWYLLYFLYID